jgi:hypothetical protein
LGRGRTFAGLGAFVEEERLKVALVKVVGDIS